MAINNSPVGGEAEDSVLMENHSIVEMIIQPQPVWERSAFPYVMPASGINFPLETSVSMKDKFCLQRTRDVPSGCLC